MRAAVTARELNRATLARQLLLERAALTAVEGVERLAGLQAQDSTGPYIALWSRLRGFERHELTAAVQDRRVVVATLQRVTMHMVTASDHRWLKPTLRPVHERTRRRPVLRDLDHDAVLAAARRRLPTRIPDLRDLAPPGVNQGYFTDFLQANLPVVRVPPAGTWGVGGSPVQELVEIGDADPRRLVRSYLAAFGPATVRDAQAWSGLSRLGPVFAELDLDDLGGGYVDVPGAPRPPADEPAPVRFLPRYDNLLIGYADRTRFGNPPIGEPTVLVDGVVAATWRWTGDDVEITPERRLPREAEAERVALRDWLAAR
jgi:Winged helix DNA-binding domain